MDKQMKNALRRAKRMRELTDEQKQKRVEKLVGMEAHHYSSLVLFNLKEVCDAMAAEVMMQAGSPDLIDAIERLGEVAENCEGWPNNETEFMEGDTDGRLHMFDADDAEEPTDEDDGYDTGSGWVDPE